MTDGHLTDGWEPDLPVADTLLRPLPFDRPEETLDAAEGFDRFLPLTRFTLWHRPRPGPSGAATTS